MTDKRKQESKAVAEDDSGIVDIGPDGAPAAIPKGGTGALLRNRKVLIGGAAAVLLLGAGAGAMLFLGSGGHGTQATSPEGHAAPEEEASSGEEGGEGHDGELPLVDVPAMVVNMRTADGTSRYLKLHFMLEANSAAKTETLKAKLPAIIDACQPFLRELRPEDISGSAAVFRIKEEMLVRATQVAGRGMVRDVLIQDLVQQ